MLRAALRRFLLLTVGLSLAIAAVAALIGLALGWSLDRAVYLGFYWIGSLALLAGVFVGSRGPVRVKSETGGPALIPLVGNRMLRWATPKEQDETINNSAVFVAVGVVLLFIGIVVDSRHTFL